MLSSISPLGERARASRWWLTTTAYVLGSLARRARPRLLAAAVGALCPSRWRSSPLGAGSSRRRCSWSGLALDLRVGGLALPSWRRQVDEPWLARYRGWVYGVGFGAQLGFGLVTIITSSTTYAVVLLAAAAGLAGGGPADRRRLRAGAGAALGADGRGATTAASLHRVFSRVERWAKPADVVARVALAAGAVALGAAAVGS